MHIQGLLPHITEESLPLSQQDVRAEGGRSVPSHLGGIGVDRGPCLPSSSLGVGSLDCLVAKAVFPEGLYITMAPKTMGFLSLRSGMKTDVWPWKGVPASTKAENTPQEKW